MSQNINRIKLNQIRRGAQKIDNPKFKDDFAKVVNPVLDKYRDKGVTDTQMKSEIDEVIRKVEQLARDYQYLPNIGSSKEKRDPEDFKDMNGLLELELMCITILSGLNEEDEKVFPICF